MAGDRLIEDPVDLGHRCGHRLGKLRPQAGRALDVGEQKRHRPRRRSQLGVSSSDAAPQRRLSPHQRSSMLDHDANLAPRCGAYICHMAYLQGPPGPKGEAGDLVAPEIGDGLDEAQASAGAQSAPTALLHLWKAAVTLPLSRSMQLDTPRLRGRTRQWRLDLRCRAP